MKCLDDSEAELRINGNFDSEKATNLMVVFERCDVSKPENNCVDDIEFEAWLRSKYIITLENEKKFVNHKFD